MKEIGGFLKLDDFKGQQYYHDLIKLNNGTNALSYIVKAKNIKKVYIPDYLCDTIELALRQLNCEYDIYPVGENFEIAFDRELQEDEYLYIVNYYGQLSDETIWSLKQRYGNIIVDSVQAFYQRPLRGVDTFYSCRKFFGVSDGAYLSTDEEVREPLKRDISRERMDYVIGSYEGTSQEYYQRYRDTEQSFYFEELKRMSKLTENILGAIDYERISKVRSENYQFLSQELSDLNILKLKSPLAPFAYPLYIDNGDVVRKKLIDKKIYVPILWPNVLERESEDAVSYRYAKHILPLPCDQRYGISDMKYLMEVLRCIV